MTMEEDVQQLMRTVQLSALQKVQLQAICSVNGLPKTGNKTDLQRRIVSRLDQCLKGGDQRQLNEIRESILSHQTRANTRASNTTTPSQTPPSTQPKIVARPSPQPAQVPTPRPPPQTTIPKAPAAYYPHRTAAQISSGPTAYQTSFNGSPAGPSAFNVALPSPKRPLHISLPSLPGVANGHAARRQPSEMPGSFFYQHSPFYEPHQQIGETRTLDVMAAHRQTVPIQIRASNYPVLSKCSSDPTMRVMVFCAAGNNGTQDIAFPFQSELKVNGGDVKANLRGLKNKPGSTKPVDITDMLRLKQANYSNNVEFTYALTSKKYYLSIILCKIQPIETLAAQITRKIRKESVIAEITQQASDPDVIATAQNLSLKCPLSYMRLKIPCRGLACTHVQCFDVMSYLQLQEQGPQWICPICSNRAPFEQLAVDEYVREILSETPESVDQVTIEPSGKWMVPGAKKDPAPKTWDSNLIDDDDLFVSGSSHSFRGTSTPNPAPSASTRVATPSSGISRDVSTAPRSSSKRPAPEVIDLTLSDDDDEPVRPAKRANTGFGSAL